jgi:hypothetical protein
MVASFGKRELGRLKKMKSRLRGKKLEGPPMGATPGGEKSAPSEIPIAFYAPEG